MFKVTRVIHFCYGHRLLNYSGKCRYLHGHNGRVEIELSTAKLDRLGMVRDFEEIKRSVQGWIDEHLDHKMILNARDPILATLQKLGEPCFVLEENPTAEAIAKHIFDVAKRMKLPVTSVKLWETEHSFAAYDGGTSVRRG